MTTPVSLVSKCVFPNSITFSNPISKRLNKWDRHQTTVERGNHLVVYPAQLDLFLSENDHLTVSAIGCLIESFHSDGNDPMFTTKASIKIIIKKAINDGIK